MTAGNKYQGAVKDVIREFDPSGANRYFLFGSSVRDKKFHDIDLGVVGNAAAKENLGDLRDLFYDSPIPYKIDVVDFDEAKKTFVDYVMTYEPIVWLN